MASKGQVNYLTTRTTADAGTPLRQPAALTPPSLVHCAALMQAKVETKPGSGKTKNIKALRVKWGEGFDQVDPEDVEIEVAEGERPVATRSGVCIGQGRGVVVMEGGSCRDADVKHRGGSGEAFLALGQ